MRHLKSGSKLGRNPWHRRATLRNLVTNLFEHGRITTTLTRAKAARPVAEKMITFGKRDTLQSRRQAAAYIMTNSPIAPAATPASSPLATASGTAPKSPSSNSWATNSKPKKRKPKKRPRKKNP